MASGSTAFYIIKKPSAQNWASTTTLSDDSDLFFPVFANRVYAFRFFVPFTLNSILSGYQFKVNTPASPTAFTCTVMLANGATGALLPLGFLTTVTNYANALATSGDHLIVLEGILENGANAGLISLQAAQNVSSASALTIKKHATLMAGEIP